MPIIAFSGKGTLTLHGQKILAGSQYARGKSFLGAALLLRRSGGNEYVVLHLICQAIEIVAKACLMFSDFDKHGSEKLRKRYNHDLASLVPDAFAEFRITRPRPALLAELRTLNSIYVKHWLRYPSGYNLLVDPKTIPSDLVLRTLAAVIRLAERELAHL